MCQKRPITVSKETYYSVKRDLLQSQKRLIGAARLASDEVLRTCVKRDVLQNHKRPIIQPKETYWRRALGSVYMCQKSPIVEPKETYYRAKRDIV